MKNILFRFRYPKMLFLLFTIILSYFIFRNPIVSSYFSDLETLGYFGVFLGGVLFSFGFTAPFSVGLFISLAPSNIWIAGIIGGLGALVSDLLIFKFIRFSFKDEFKKLNRAKPIREIEFLIQKSFGAKIKVYIMYVFAGILIASPLPDEVGVTMLAGLTKISIRFLAIISFVLNTLGIIIILSL